MSDEESWQSEEEGDEQQQEYDNVEHDDVEDGEENDEDDAEYREPSPEPEAEPELELSVIKSGLGTVAALGGTSAVGFGHTTLNLSGRQLTTLKGQLARFTSLRQLDVSNNAISDATITASLPNLYSLNLQRNRIVSLDGFADDGASIISKLSVLQVDNNRLKSLPSLTIKHLKFLSACNNRIAKLDGFAAPALEHIHLGGNRLRTLSSSSSESSAPTRFTQAVTLNVSQNKITDLRGIGKTFPALTSLDLTGNRLSSLAGLEEECASTLTSLRLGSNALVSLSEVQRGLRALSKLTELDISGNDELMNADAQEELQQQMQDEEDEDLDEEAAAAAAAAAEAAAADRYSGPPITNERELRTFALLLVPSLTTYNGVAVTAKDRKRALTARRAQRAAVAQQRREAALELVRLANEEAGLEEGDDGYKELDDDDDY